VRKHNLANLDSSLADVFCNRSGLALVMSNKKGSEKMIKSWLTKLTNPVVIRAAVLALVLSPAVSLANAPAKTKGHVRHIVRQPVSQAVQFQGLESAEDWDHNADGFYTPTRSPGFNELNH